MSAHVSPSFESVLNSSSSVSADAQLMLSDSTQTAGGKTTAPTGASEASPAAATMENRPTEKQTKNRKKKGIRTFFRRIGKAIKRCTLCCYGDDILPPFPCDDPADLQPGLSGLEWALSIDPCPSGIELTVNADSADPEPPSVSGASSLEVTPDSDPADPVPSHIPGPSSLDLKLTLDPGLAEMVSETVNVPGPSRPKVTPVPSLSSIELKPDVDPTEPKSSVSGPSTLDSEVTPVLGPSGFGAAVEQQSKIRKKKGMCVFFRRTWRAVRRAALCYRSDNKVAPDPFAVDPMAHQDPADLQPGLFIPFWVLTADPGPSGFELTVTANQDLSDSHLTLDPGPAGLVVELMSVPGPSSHEIMPAPSPTTLKLTPDMGLDVPEPKPVSGSSLKLTPIVDLAYSESPSASGPSSYRPDTDRDNPKQKFVPILSGYWPTAASFSSRYDVEVKLGQGAFGSVYEGTRRSNGQKVAMKFLTNKGWNTYISVPGSTKPLLLEVAINAIVCAPPKSPHIVEMIEWFDEPDRYVIVMEYPHPCETLLAFRMRHRSRLDESMARCLMRQAVLAAKHCIERGVLHNDIKTDNILVNTETLQLKLIDFSCSERINICCSKDCEWAVGSTVWSLAVVLLEIVNGDQPINVSKECDTVILNFSNEFHDLIGQCVGRHQSRRPTLEQVLEHPWFKAGLKEGRCSRGR
ncbi:hypothetical protein Q8A67_008150 [Cirrhinus molitorella]|uniref:non-specific serine/threonine protein kinase n=1 Tax=Cirrhinus molitorella TaxID=172907 RepID=A0AA88PWS5_9TELE|nr:hypothetical protein Q8A67_008150 [Cirrhinus molitorella]